MHSLNQSQAKELVDAWQEFLKHQDWQSLTKGHDPVFTAGPIIFTLQSPLDRPDESFGVVDMRELRMDQVSPHYHTNGETEIHFGLEGHGLMVVGGKEITIEKGKAVVVPPDTGHYTFPEGLIVAVVNTPAFDSDNNVGLSKTESKPSVGFDCEQFKRLVTDNMLAARESPRPSSKDRFSIV